MRYKAYYSETDIENVKPKNLDSNGNPIPLFEDDDQHMLQYKIKEAGIDFRKVKIVDTFYEDRFNKRQEELQKENYVYIQESVDKAIAIYKSKDITQNSVNAMRNDIAKALSLNPIIGVEISAGEIFLKQIGEREFSVSLPAYNINNIKFTL